VRSAGVLRDVSADRTHLLTGGVRCEVIPLRRGGFGDIKVDHTRLHDGSLVGDVDLQDPAHLRRHDEYALGMRQRATGEPGSRTAGHERHLVLGAGPHDLLDLLRVLRKHHDGGDHPVSGKAVALVGA
jgi:hypothetical protein